MKPVLSNSNHSTEEMQAQESEKKHTGGATSPLSTAVLRTGNTAEEMAKQRGDLRVTVTAGGRTSTASGVQFPAYHPTDYILSLTHSILHILLTSLYRQSLYRVMPVTVRARLEALRRQVLFGDAPLEEEAEGGASTPKKPYRAHPQAALLQPPSRWLDFQARLEWDTWAKMRGQFPGTMAPWDETKSDTPGDSLLLRQRHISLLSAAKSLGLGDSMAFISSAAAAETLCTEFMEQMEAHKDVPAVACQLMPLLHAALNRAHQDAMLLSAEQQQPSPSGRLAKAVPVPLVPPAMEFRVKALQCDPAAIALLWVCRTFALPASFEFEPLPPLYHQQPDAGGHRLSSGIQPYEPPFLATLHTPHSPWTSAEVRSPTGAFALLADHLLHRYRYLAGEHPVHSTKEEEKKKSATSRESRNASLPAFMPQRAEQLTQERAAWIDELAQITELLRTPLLHLLMDGKYAEEVRLYGAGPSRQTHRETDGASRPDLSDLNTVLLRRTALLRATAEKFHRLESFWVERAKSRNAKDEGKHRLWQFLNPSLGSFPASQRAVGLSHLRRYWKSPAEARRAVSLVDLYLACCGYVLTTNPYCTDLFPVDTDAPAGGTVQVPVKQTTLLTPAALTPAAAAAAATAARPVSVAPVLPPVSPPVGTAPMGSATTPLSNSSSPTSAMRLLSRRPRFYGLRKRATQDFIIHVLQMEERFARLHRQLPLRLSTRQRSSPGVPFTPSTLSATTAFPVSLLVQNLILSRLQTCSEDLTPKPGPPSCWRYPPFVILAQSLARAWHIADAQCPGFPSLLLHVQAQVMQHATLPPSAGSSSSSEREPEKEDTEKRTAKDSQPASRTRRLSTPLSHLRRLRQRTTGGSPPPPSQRSSITAPVQGIRLSTPSVSQL